MNGPDPAVSAVRTAVRRFLADAGEHLTCGGVAVAVSGGADSLALAAATAHVAGRLGLAVRGLVVDHGLQAGSAEVAERAAGQCRELGLDAEVLPVVVQGPGGPEAAARRARYAALRPAKGLVLLGHTMDDQAETVLLGLGRGSGPRSIAGMRPLDPPWGRPLLGTSRATTTAACAALGLDPWLDPHNTDPAFTRVRLRADVLPLLEDVLHGGVAAALARTAAQLREDNDALDGIAEAFGGDPADIAALEPLPAAVRRRVIRRWLLASGTPELSDSHVRAVDALVAGWKGQGGVWLSGGLVARRAHGRLRLDPRQS
ncbi:tRNA lysidine(34) synthetase TilS [Umezawaea sp. Da 62-37]|uniref:tRNA lysidine(34) synthetase TilS n=1 Tax=Umezawaea sp. Da 62-37 TaxID=3075927 RepID=UPI0028F6E4F1|nr:tRNA lysidine(34) synthetase TilS [Umezawaea sp. Da 62-37]WNV91755.1 tRNA lysidine(34) synthetase TilS [Umezawaea sp. Da 62-37]